MAPNSLNSHNGARNTNTFRSSALAPCYSVAFHSIPLMCTTCFSQCWPLSVCLS